MERLRVGNEEPRDFFGGDWDGRAEGGYDNSEESYMQRMMLPAEEPAASKLYYLIRLILRLLSADFAAWVIRVVTVSILARLFVTNPFG